MLIRRFNTTTSIFVIICIAIFFVLKIFPGVGSYFYMDTFFLWDRPWILLTTNFTHLTSEHLFDNLFVLFCSGLFISALTEDPELKSIHIILGTGLLSGIIQALFIPGISLGASAVACALVMFASGKILFKILDGKTGWFLSVLLSICFLYFVGRISINIYPLNEGANSAHLAGTLFGILAFVFEEKIWKRRKNEENLLYRMPIGE